MKRKVVCIIQARMNSTRLPGKVLMPLDLNGNDSINLILNRLAKSKLINKIAIGTTTNIEDDLIARKCQELNVFCYRGEVDNVLSRYWEIANLLEASIIVRVTADCPLIDPDIVDKVIKHLLLNNCDYSSNVYPPIHPDGLDVEVFTYESLRKAFLKSNKEQFEHVTGWITDSKQCNCLSLKSLSRNKHIRVTLDYKEDLKVIRTVIEEIGVDCNLDDLLDLYDRKPYIWEAVKKYIRNQGENMTNKEKNWARATTIIPGGNMILSKNPDLYIKKKWPPYYEKAKGCEIWDIEGNHYYDFATMGIGTNVLGYANESIDSEVAKAITKGNMSSLNCIEELMLAEKIIDISPDAEMIKFARTGGEANAIAVRIARAAADKDCIAICGYHGWHDWYLACNLKSKNSLDSHLISDLDPIGVPQNLEGTIFGFEYNNIKQLNNLIETKNIGIIKMEVERNIVPKDGFLEQVRAICDEKNIILIFDECTSAFRSVYGGLQKKYSVFADMTIYGKTIGNGYALTAVVGKESIMQYAKNCFISSTFWSERIGYVAAIATLKEMKRLRSWEMITSLGKSVKNFWNESSIKFNLPLEIFGLDSLASFEFIEDQHKYKKTFMISKLLDKGILGCDSFYASIAHEKHLHIYFEAMEEVFKELRDVINNGELVSEVKDLVPLKKRFKRLN